MANVTIRDAKPSDIPVVTAIYEHHVLTSCASFEITPPDTQEMTRRYETIRERGLPYIVAEIEGAVRGYGYAGMYRPREAYRFTVEHSIYLHPEWTRKGLGRELLTVLIAQCTEWGARQMVAVIGDGRNAGSIRLHESFGFRHVGEIRSAGYKLGRWVDSVLMQLPLGDADATPPE